MPYEPHVVLTTEQLEEVVAGYEKLDEIVFDVETVATREPRPSKTKGADKPALDERTNSVTWLSLAGEGRVDVIPMGHPGPPQLSRYEVLTGLKDLFFSDRWKIGHNVLFDALSLAKYWDAIPPGPYCDTRTLTHLLNENLFSYKLGDLVQRYFSWSYRKLGNEGKMDEFSFEEVARYVGHDAKLTHLLWKRQHTKIKDLPALYRIFELESDITELLIWAKQRGALVNRDGFGELDARLALGLEDLEEKIYAEAGQKFLITSSKQKAKVLYEDLGLKCKVFTPKTHSPSASEAALRPLVRAHPIVPMLMEHADLSKLRSAYTTGFVPFIDDDSRIRASLNQSGASTGRFSASKPNVQTLPRESGESDLAKIRSLFIAPPGYVLVVGDFSQIEYRIMAHLAGPMVKNSRLLEAFNAGIDLHTMTAAGLNDKPPEKVTKTERQGGKTANFCFCFGGSANRMVQAGVGVEEAERAYKLFHSTYPEISRYTNVTVKRLRKMGDDPYAETLWGRRRRLPDLTLPLDSKENGRLRSSAERQAVNHFIQGSAADINKSAMVRAFRRIERLGKQGKWHLILTVHDEIVLEVPENEAEQGVEVLRESMEGVKVDLRVPLIADVHYGHNWAEAK